MPGMRFQPQGRAKLLRSHPLCDGLVFASVAGGADLISGTLPVKIGNASISAFEKGKTLATNSTTTDGWYWPLPTGHPLYSITTQDSIFVIARRSASAGFGNFIGVPYRSGSWTNPFYAWALSAQSDTSVASHSFAPTSSTRTSAVSSSGFYVNGATQIYGSTRNWTRLRFYRDRSIYGGDIAGGGGSPDWANRQPLMLFNRSNSSVGEGMQAQAGLVLIWNRELSPDEWAQLAANPWQLFAEDEEDQDIAAGADAGASGLISSALDGSSMLASGSLINSGALASTLGNAVLAASGNLGSAPAGSLTSSLASAAMFASGAVNNRGALAAMLDGAALAAVGAVAQQPTGTLASTLAGASMHAAGYLGDEPPAQTVRPYRWRIARRHISGPP